MSLSVGRIASSKFKSAVVYVASLALALVGTVFIAPQFIGQVAYAAEIHTQADFAAFDGVDIGTNSYTVSSGVTATYTGSNTIKLTGYAPIVTPWFGKDWTTYNYVTVGIKLPANFAGTTSVYQTGIMRYDVNPAGAYKMGTIGDGTTPLATDGAAKGYLDYSFAANSINTTKDGLVKLEVIWNADSAPEYFTIDITDLQTSPVFIDTNTNGIFDSGELSFNTIQAAISAATAGDTIHITAGTYTTTGQIVINKNLSIVGADKATTIIKPSGNIGEANYSTTDTDAWFLVNPGKTFNLSNVTLDGTGKYIREAIRHHGNGVIDNLIIKQIKSTNPYLGTAININSTGTINVTNTNFSQIGRVGIVFKDAVTSTLSNNVYVGKGDGDWLDYAFDIQYGAHVTINNNQISHNRGVVIDGNGPGENSISAGISVWDDADTQATMNGNTFTDNTAGVGIAVYYEGESDPVVTIGSGNTFSGNDIGIDIQNAGGTGSPTVTVTGSTFSNNTIGIQVPLDMTVSNITVHDSILSGNTTSVANLGTGTLDASNNYWGSANPNFATIISGDVDYATWYVDAGRTTTNIDLAAAKTTAHDALTTARALYIDTDYTSDDLATLNGFKTNGDTNIDAALTTDAVTSAQTTATAGMSGVPKLTATQTTPDSETGDATLSGDTTQVVLTDETQAVTVDIASGTVDPTIDVSAFVSLVDGEQTGTLPEITITSDVADVTIPDGTVVTGPADWDGIIDAPTAGTSDGDVAPAGFSVGGTVISIGSAYGTLWFNTAVSIVLPGVTGAVGYRPALSSTWQTIDTECTSATDHSNISSGECYFHDNGDTIIWTYHFTSFGELLAVVVPPVAPVTPTTPVATTTSSESETYYDNSSQVGTDNSLGSQATLGSQTTNDKTADSLANPAALAATDNGWSIFGLAWYWWLIIVAVVTGLVWWIIAGMRRDQI